MAAAQRPKGWKLLKAALATRKSSTMLAFGFSSGLPYALLIGTLNAWLGEAKINLATLGVLSWIGLSYSFKFLWSPVVDRMPLPLLEAIGRRKSWIVLCQAVMIAAFAGLAATNPATNIGAFALVLAARMSWSLVYLLMGGLILLMVLVALQAPDTQRPDTDVLHKQLEEPGALEPKARVLALVVVGVSWAWAIITIAHFMISMLTTAPGQKQPAVA